jgi:hypothetical protein
MLQARLGKLLGLQHEEELVLLSPDEQRLWQVRAPRARAIGAELLSHKQSAERALFSPLRARLSPAPPERERGRVARTQLLRAPPDRTRGARAP